MSDATRLDLTQRTEAEQDAYMAEQDAYMAGQISALELARRKGIDYAEEVLQASHSTIRRSREETRES